MAPRIRIAAAAVAVFFGLSTAGARGAVVTQPPCAHPAVRATVFYSAPGAWLENLGFDGRGGLWVGEIRADQVVRLNAAGAVRSSFPLSYPGAIEAGPDGRMYANFGDSPSSGTLNLGQAGVVHFRPEAAKPRPRTFVSGLQMANGAAFNSAGRLFVSDTDNGVITKIRPDGSIDRPWTRAAQIASANGLAVAGKILYVAVTDDPDSTIYRVPLHHPAARTVVAKLSGGAIAPKGLDDLTVGPDGRLYVTSVRGDLIRVNPATGSACLLYSGPPLTSVRFAAHFGSFTHRRDLFATSETGVLMHLRLSRR